MSIHARPRNPYRVASFVRAAWSGRRLWFTPKLIDVHNFKAGWHQTDRSFFARREPVYGPLWDDEDIDPVLCPVCLENYQDCEHTPPS